MKIYQVAEIKGKHKETYMMGFETDAEMSRWLDGKRAFEDERKYSITAWSLTSEGFGYINLRKHGYTEI